MKSLPSIIAAIVLVAVLAFYMCTFQVRSTEVAIKKTFGEADEEPIAIDEDDRSFFAGLHAKWPWPIQSVAKYDKRLRILVDRIEETPTRDSKQIVLTTFTAWTIADPYKFHTRYQTVDAAEDVLRNRIRSIKKAVIGNHDFSEFVSTRESDRQMRAIEQEMMTALADDARESFGIDIQAFGIKQLSLPSNVTQAVFETMKSTQKIKADTYRSEGNAEGSRILASAEASAERIRAVVQRKVDEIEAQGLEEVGRIYKAFAEHQELRIFLDKLHALERILRDRVELFMDTDFQPMDLWSPEKRMELMREPDLGKEQGSARDVIDDN